jgi:hypothetical protein
MTAQRISVKFFVDDAAAVDLPAFIPLFQRWIREGLVEGVPIDVANYAHVPNGPGIVLVGHEGDYALNMAEGRPGLRYTHKREWPTDDLADRIQLTLTRGLAGVELLAQENLISLDSGRFQLAFYDQLRLPSVARVKEAVGVLFSEQYSVFSEQYSVVSEQDDGKRPLTLEIELAQPLTAVAAPALAEVA